jgi:DNA replication protein DnaC
MKYEKLDNFIKDLEERRNSAEIEKYGRVLTDEERSDIDRKRVEEFEASRERNRIELNYSRFSHSVPARFREARFSNFTCFNEKQKSVVEFIKQGTSAVIYGSNGVGKTHLAFASCFHQIEQGKTAGYVLAFDFFNEIRKSFGDYTTNSIINEYKHYDYLVIDEIDKTQGTPMEFTYLYSLINKRYNEMKSTVLITNAKPADFAAIIGQSALDRVASEGKVIDLTGDNYRQRKFKDM